MATTLSDSERVDAIDDLETQFADGKISSPEITARKMRLEISHIDDFIPPTPAPPPPPPTKLQLLEAEIARDKAEAEAKFKSCRDAIIERCVNPPSRPPCNPFASLSIKGLREILESRDFQYARHYVETLARDGEMDQTEVEIANELIAEAERDYNGTHEPPAPEIKFDNDLVQQVVKAAGDDLEHAEELAYQLAGAVQAEQWRRREKTRIEKELRSPRRKAGDE